MAGITAYGAYIPWWRLGPESKEWNQRGERAVASFDEDSITMAVAAVLNCLGGTDRRSIDGLYFASTTSPYTEKQAAATVAAAADLPASVFTADFTNTTRAGTVSLKAALDAVNSGSMKKVLVVAADMRPAKPRSDFEAAFGDGAAALLVSTDGAAATVEGSHSVSDEMLDVWRSSNEPQLRSWEDRFVADEGYTRILSGAVTALAKKMALAPKDLTRAAIYAPDARRHADMVRRLGLDPRTQVVDPLAGSVGNTGAAYALMLLVSALEEAGEGDRLLLASYGNGADVLVLRAGKGSGGSQHRTVKALAQSKKLLDSYETFTKWRGTFEPAPATRRPPLQGPSATATWRERDANIRFYGVRCTACGYPQYPPQRVCTRCHEKDRFEPYRFSDKKGSIYTYSMDYLGATVQPPLVIAVVNYEGGGRILTQMTDRDPSQLKVGLPVEMTFRKLYSADGVHNYYWKSMPVRA